MESVIEWISTSLKLIKHKVFEDATKVEVKVEPMGDGQVVIVSEINRVLLSLEKSNGDKKEIKAIAKVEPRTGAGQQMVQQFEVFKTEMMFYQDLAMKMENLLSETGDTEYLWPECYYCGDNKFLLEDLCEAGYKVVPTYKFLDYQHTMLVMKAIGKWHALSMVMHERELLDLYKLKPSYWSRRVPFIINLHKMYIGNLAKVIKEKWDPEWHKAGENLEKFVENPGDSMYSMWLSQKDTWTVLNHGDFTMRNMLFHYPSESSVPDAIKFVDFQACSYGSLGIDLGNLLYSSLLPAFRDEHLDEFLNCYIETVRNTCKNYGFKGPVPTVEDAKSCLKSLSYLTTATSLCGVPFFIASERGDVQKKADECMEAFISEELSSEDAVDKDDMFYNDERVLKTIKYEIKRLIDEKIL